MNDEHRSPTFGKRSRPPLPRWTVPVVALLVSGTAVVVLAVLWRWIDGLALVDVEKRAATQLDAVKIAASTAVGGGGLFALYLAARRQRTQELELDVRHAELAQRDRVQAHAERVAEANRLHAERVAADTRSHSEAQRVTELYTKASEQLGSDKAPVRLAGLYALERLAQDNPDRPTLRRTVVNVLCAYLRMPFDLPGDAPPPDADQPTRTRHREQVQEREVRVTAQTILATHLRPGDDPDHLVDAFWSDIDLDFTGAVLVDFNMSRCRLRRCHFDHATFTGITLFVGTAFSGEAAFGGAVFTGYATFTGATFGDLALFAGTAFEGANFADAVFAEHTRFDRASFGNVTFARATFSGYAAFRGTAFAGGVTFDSATFAQGIGWDALAVHPLPGGSTWPGGVRPADEHGPAEGRDGTWHRFVTVGSGA